MRFLLFTGINKYSPAVFGDIDLNGCVADTARMQSALLGGDDDVTVLHNAKATAKAVLNWIAETAKKAVAGDVVVWFHSGHGTYQDTDNGRHTIRVMYSEYLYDTTVANALSEFKRGVTVLTISDTCHAESNSRAVLKPPADNAVRKSVPFTKAAPAILLANAQAKQEATIYHLSACKADEVAWEIGDGGLFTTTFARVCFAYTKATTITTLFTRLRKNIVNQTPVLEAINKGRTKTLRL